MLYNQSLVNLHTHSFYCKHGTGTIAQFVSQAKEDGLRVLGFSEHCPLPDREYQKGNRMDYPDLPFYEADVRAQMNDPDIRVLLGAECDWLPDEESFYRDGLLSERGYDYLCCSIHHMVDPSDGREKFIQYINDMPVGHMLEYVRLYTDALRSGLFLFGCHPDLFLAGYRHWDADSKAASMDIIQCARECDIPLEINDNGLRKKIIETENGPRHPYPVREFWEMARDEGLKIVTNSDAHRPKDVAAHLTNSFAFASQAGISFASWDIEDSGITCVQT